MPPLGKSKLLWKLAELLEKPENQKVFHAIDVLDVGAPPIMMGLSLGQCVDNLRYFGGWADKITGKTLHVPGGNAYTLRDPIGVCAGIIPVSKTRSYFYPHRRCFGSTISLSIRVIATRT